jgi:type IV pilus assembly protein PilF
MTMQRTMRFLLLSFTLLLGACATMDRSQNERAAEVNTQLGIEYMRQGEFEQAMKNLERAVSQNPNYADARIAIALLYDRLDEPDKALPHYRRAVELAPDDSAILNNYGRFLCGRGEVAEAERLFKRSADNPLYRSREVPLTNAGLCVQRIDETARAEQYFMRALEANPQFAPALLPMAEIRHRGGHHLSARGFYQRYLELAPQTAETLWLGINIERELDNRDAVASYSLALRSRFPDSEQTRLLLESKRDER